MILIIALFMGIFISIIPLFIFFERSCRINKIKTVEAAYSKGMLISFIIGSSLIYFMLKNSSGEAGLVGGAMAPFILIGSLISGLTIVSIYKKRDRPFWGRMSYLTKFELGDIYKKENNSDTARVYYEKGIEEIYDRYGDIIDRGEYKYLPDGLDKIMDWLAQYYEIKENYDKATYYYEYFLDMSAESNCKSKLEMDTYETRLKKLYSKTGKIYEAGEYKKNRVRPEVRSNFQQAYWNS